MKMKLVILVVGALGGAAGMHFAGGAVRQAVGLEGREVEANVLEETRDEDGRLVLMLESEGESMLATFRERADDVASLVQVGDVISFRTPIHGVFSDDVPLLSVRRPEPVEGEESEEDSEDEEIEEDQEDEPVTGDEPVGEELVGDELAEDELAEDAAREVEPSEPAENEGEAEESAPEPVANTGPAVESDTAES